MLCGRPALVTDVAGNGEVVTDGITGFLAESPTVQALGRAMERMWERRGELQQMGDAASSRIRELVPRDPVAVFASKLRALIDTPVDNPGTAEVNAHCLPGD